MKFTCKLCNKNERDSNIQIFCDECNEKIKNTKFNEENIFSLNSSMVNGKGDVLMEAFVALIFKLLFEISEIRDEIKNLLEDHEVKSKTKTRE